VVQVLQKQIDQHSSGFNIGNLHRLSKLINTETMGSGCCLDNRMRQDVGWEKGKKQGKRVNLRG
jgi:hypothetical protein